MEDEIPSNSKMSLYLLLVFALCLLTIQTLDTHNLIHNWHEFLSLPTDLLEKSQYDMYFKSCIISFSLLSGLSAFFLVVLMLVDFDYFIDKLLSTYMYFN